MRALLHISLLATVLSACTTAPPKADPKPVETVVAPKKAPEPAPGFDPAPKDATPVSLTAARSAIDMAKDASLRDAAARAKARMALLQDPFPMLSDASLRGPKDLVLVAVGDVSQPGKQWPKETNSLKTKAFAPTQSLLDSGDLVAMNLENPVSDKQPTAKKEFSFTSPPERLGWYMDVGFNVFSLSNNHIFDAGQQGVDDTLLHLAQTSKEKERAAYWAGAGATVKDAEAPITIELPDKNLKIAFFSTGFSRGPTVSKFWSKTLIPNIKKAKATHDLVFVAVHAGKEYKHLPERDQVSRYHKWIDAGADVIIGHHPHVIRPVEVYKKGLILHSLGNYVFASRTRRHKKFNARLYGLVARVIIRDGKVAGAELTPTWVNNAHGWTLPTGESIPQANFTPKVLTGAFADAFFEDFNRWSEAAQATVPTRVGDVARIMIKP